MKINRWAIWLSALLCALFVYSLHAASSADSWRPAAATAGATHAARVHLRAGVSALTPNADQIFSNGFEAAQPTCTPGQDLDHDGLFDLTCVSLDPVPDPSTVATLIDPTVVTDFSGSNAFLYGGPNPVQRGADPNTFDTLRLAVLRGRVLDENDQPLAGAIVRVLYGPGFGYTLSRADGWYDIAVNGGGTVVLDFQMTGRIRAQRATQSTPWLDFARVDDVALIPYDTTVTTVTIGPGQDSQWASASLVSDGDGMRQAAVYLPPGTDAYLYNPATGTSTITDTLHIRSTEFTVGSNGPHRMPASLPASSAYTYAIELSADEVPAGTLSALNFTRAVSFYTDNFVNAPVGTGVPIGYYDPSLGMWSAMDNGRVIQILGVDGSGLAQIDIQGQGSAASTSDLATLGFDSAELSRIGATYAAGVQLMRFQTTHFSAYDLNFSYVTPEDAIPPPSDEPDTDGHDDDCDCGKGSVIEINNAELGERIPISGTPYTLTYRSDSSPGRSASYSVTLSATGGALPASLQSAQVNWTVAGVSQQVTLPAIANQSQAISWDGRDAYGRTLVGPRPISITVGYVYNGLYAAPAQVAQSFGQWGASGVSFSTLRSQIILQNNTATLLGTTDARIRGFGVWSIDAQHVYDPISNSLWLGSGVRRDGRNIYPSVKVAAGSGSAGTPGDGIPAASASFYKMTSVSTTSDGSLLIADWFSGTVSRVDRGGTLTRLFGNGVSDCEVVPCVPTPTNAKDASAYYPSLLAPGTDGCIYVGGQAADTEIAQVCGSQALTIFYQQSVELQALAAGPDGMLYASVSTNAPAYEFKIYKINPWGGNPTAFQVLATSTCSGVYYGGDGGSINDACFSPQALAVAKDGSIYFADQWNAIRRIGPDGIITRIAGRPLPDCADGTQYCGGHTGDGGLAINAKIIVTSATQIALKEDGSIYYTHGGAVGDNTVRVIDPNGIIRTMAGNSQNIGYGCNYADAPATSCPLDASALAVGRDGLVYVGTRLQDPGYTVRSLPTTNIHSLAGATYIPAQSGSELYVLDSIGRHSKSIDPVTGTTTTQLGYTGGLLTSVADAFGNTTNIQRDGSGNITITAPDGQVTQILVDGNGLAQHVIGPTNDTYTLGYTNGLLTTFQRPNGAGYASTIGYTGDGRLATDANAAGGGWTLTPSGTVANKTITMQSAMGRVTAHNRSEIGSGGRNFTTTEPDGSVSSRSITPDGVEQRISADGTQVRLTQQPDPRFGMSTPMVDKTVATPGGIVYAAHTQRTVALSDSSDPLTVTAIAQTTTVNGRAYASSYDAASQTWTLTSPMGRTRKVTINAQNQPLHVSLPGLATVDYHYDSRGRLDDVGAGAVPNRRDTLIGYDSYGFVDSVQDPALRTTVLTNDATGRTTTQTLPDLRKIGLRYDADSSVQGITPPSRPEHTFGYNSIDSLIAYTPPAVAGVSDPHTGYGYNPDQQFTSATRPDGLSVTPNYNGVTGLLDHIDTPDGSYGYTWLSGHRVQQRTAPGSVQLNYTWDGALLKNVSTSGPFGTSVGYTYDTNFWLTHLTTPGGTVDYGYDNDGLLTSANVGTTNLILTRDPQNGMLTGTTLGQVTDGWGYNEFAEPHTYTANVNDTPVLSTTYTRDALGRISDKTETILGDTHITRYGYDTAGRLQTVTIDGQASAEYTYDDNSNRQTHTVDVASTLLGQTIPCLGTLSAPVIVNAGVADAQDRLPSYGTCTYLYGANGELQSRTDTATSQTTTYTYDVFGNLRHVTLPDSTQIDYVIDGQNRRIGKKLNGTLIQGFVYANQLKPVAELDGSGNVVSTFVYADRANIPSYILKGGNVYRIIADHLGSPRLALNVADGTVAQRIDYDEWGNVTNDTNPGFQPFGFAGGIYDRDTGLVRFGARDYDSTTGRWLAKDWIGFRGGLSFYEYTGNEPINRVDPSGFATLNAIDYAADPGLQAWGDGYNPAGYNSVVVHGTVNTDGQSTGQFSDGVDVIDPINLAWMLMGAPGYDPKLPTILISCDAAGKPIGKRLISGAQAFADALANAKYGTPDTQPVYASPHDVYTSDVPAQGVPPGFTALLGNVPKP